MEQRDYLLRQIEMMTQFLMALIKRLMGLKSNDTEEDYKEVTNTMLKEQLDTSLEEILLIPVDEVADFIIQRKGIHQSNIDLFAEVLMINARVETKLKKKKELLIRAIELLEWADNTSGIYSMERHQKIINSKIRLQELNDEKE
jgi:hypothetical protein